MVAVHLACDNTQMASVAIPNRRAMTRLAHRVGQALLPGDLLLLEGDLGTGKTFFTRALLRSLGVTGPVTSPTFALIHEYALDPQAPVHRVIHADLYRIASIGEAEALGLHEMRAEGGALVVEWGASLREALGPRDGLVVGLELGPEGRRAEMTPLGPRGLDLVGSVMNFERVNRG